MVFQADGEGRLPFYLENKEKNIYDGSLLGYKLPIFTALSFGFI
jgi:hypothetical protein